MAVSNYIREVMKAAGGKPMSVTWFRNKIKEFGDIKVKVTTLDSFDFVDIGFIKLDVEGYETKILQGAVRTIENNNPTIVVEQNKNDFTASNFLKNLGYKHVDTWNSLSTNEPNDFIFTR